MSVKNFAQPRIELFPDETGGLFQLRLHLQHGSANSRHLDFNLIRSYPHVLRAALQNVPRDPRRAHGQSGRNTCPLEAMLQSR